jgi:cyclase
MRGRTPCPTPADPHISRVIYNRFLIGRLNRRAVLRAATGFGLATAFRAAAQTSSAIVPWPTELRQLAPGVYAYVQAGGPGVPSVSVSNAGLVAGDDHTLVIDALGAPMHAKNFIAAARRAEPAKPFGRIALTHHHTDHIVGLPLFPRVDIVAHEYCRQAMLETKFPTAIWPKQEGWAEGGEPRIIIPPTTTIREKTTLYWGNVLVELIPMAPAHTYGDLVAYLPQHKVLFAGDVGFFLVAPFLNNGHATKWIEACDRILDMEVEKIVPGHGPVGGKKELADMQGYLRLFKSEARLRFNEGMSPGKACASIKMGKYESWIGESDRRPLNMVRLYAEFDGTLTPATDTEGVRNATAEFNALRK